MNSVVNNQPNVKSDAFHDLGGHGGREARRAGRRNRNRINAIIGDCGRWGYVRECDNRHIVATRLLCGFEWCSTCGQKGSRVHKQRIARQLKRVLKAERVGYFVFTVPESIRWYYSTPERLSKLNTRILGIVKYVLGDDIRYISRWHFKGDRNKKKYYPHLNVLVNAGYLSETQLDNIKWLYREVLRSDTGYDGDVVVVDYQYVEGYSKKSLRKKYHMIEYIMRATATRDFVVDNPELNEIMRRTSCDGILPFDFRQRFYDFRNVRISRGWDVIDAMDVPEVDGFLEKLREWKDMHGFLRMESGVCPICGAHTESEGVWNFGSRYWERCNEIGCGVYEVPYDVYVLVQANTTGGCRGP
jgi:hypothetical protein